MASGRNSRYQIIARDSSESDREDIQFIAPSPTFNVHSRKDTHTHISFTIWPSVLLRLTSGTLAFVSFMILVCAHGGAYMIPTDVFLMITVLWNILVLLHQAVSYSQLFRIKVEVRNQDWHFGRGTFKNPKFTSYIDLGFALALMICIAANWTRKSRNDWNVDGGAIASVIMGYIVVGFQVILAIPMLDRLSLRFQARVKSVDTNGGRAYLVNRPDIKRVVQHAEATAIPEQEGVTQDAADLV